MSISINCKCGKRILAKEELAGRRVKCPACGKAISIPLAEQPAEQESDLLGSLAEMERSLALKPSSLQQSRPLTLSNSSHQAPAKKSHKTNGKRFTIQNPKTALYVAFSVLGCILVLGLAVFVVPRAWTWMTSIAERPNLEPIEFGGRTTEGWFMAMRRGKLSGKPMTMLNIQMRNAGMGGPENNIGADPAALPVLFDALAGRLGERKDSGEGDAARAQWVDRELAELADKILAKFTSEEVKQGLYYVKQGLNDPGPLVQIWSLRLLGRIQKEDKQDLLPTIQELAQRRDVPDPRAGSVAAAAILALGQMGPATVPFLASALKDERSDVRVAAVQALGECGPEAKNAVPLLIAACKGNKDLRGPVLAALGSIGSKAAEVILFVEESLATEKDQTMRKLAAETLVKMGPEAVPVAQKFVQTGDAELQTAIIEAIAGAGAYAEQFTPLLSTVLKVSEGNVWGRALETIGKLGPRAHTAIPTLLEELRGESSSVDAISDILVQVLPGATLQPENLAEMLHIGSPKLVGVASNMLGEMGPQAKVAVPALVQAVERFTQQIQQLEAAKREEEKFQVLIFEKSSGERTEVKWRPITVADIESGGRVQSLDEIKLRYEIRGYRLTDVEKPDTTSYDTQVETLHALRDTAKNSLSKIGQ